MPSQTHTSPLPISPLPPNPRNNPSPYHHSSPYLTSQRHQVLVIARQLISPFARKVKICRRRRKDGAGVVKYGARVVGRVCKKHEGRASEVDGEGKEEGEWEAIGEEVILVGNEDVWFESEEEAVRWLRGEVGRVWRVEGRGRGYLERGREGGWGSDDEGEEGGWV